jgi:hypothetical protein
MAVNVNVEQAAVQRARNRRALRVLGEGVIVGLVGAAVPMLLFLIIDVAAGAPFRTPAILGGALFHGAHNTEEVAITARIVLAYTAIHVGAFVIFGLAVSGLFALAEREKGVLGLIFILGCCLAVVFVALVHFVSQWMREAATTWIFLAGHALGGVVLVGSMSYRHQRLLREFPTVGE